MSRSMGNYLQQLRVRACNFGAASLAETSAASLTTGGAALWLTHLASELSR